MTLIDRLKAATANGDADLDRDIAIHFKQWPYDGSLETMSENTFWMNTPYTSSVDAALALVERMLPDSRGDVHWGDRGAKASVLRPNGDRPYFEGATPALAILKALFAAIQAKDTTHADK